MNIKSMHIGVKLGVDRVAENKTDGLLPQEIDFYLNEAIELYIKQQYSFIKDETKSMESQYALENLRTLITTVPLNPNGTVDYLINNRITTLPEDYKYYISARVKTDTYKNLTLRSSKAIKLYTVTESNSPLFREYPIIIEGNKLIVIAPETDPLSIDTTVSLTYIKEANEVSLPEKVNCNLPTHTHKEIVRLAVGQILTDLREVQ